MTNDLSNIALDIRPRFELNCNLEIKEIHERFQTKLKCKKGNIRGKLRLGYINLYHNQENHQYWSPHLSVIVEKSEFNDDTILRGHYGPSPTVWTLYVFIYAILGLMILIATVIGFANMSIGNSGMILIVVPFLFLAFLSFYFTSHYGQKKASHQIEELDNFFNDCLNSNE